LSQDIWQKTLAQLRLQMTRATFEQQLQGTTLLDHTNGVYRIAVQTEMAQEWLDNRLRETVQRTLASLTGAETVTLEFVVNHKCTAVPEPLPPPTTEATDFGLSFAQRTDFHIIKMEMGRWLPELQYDNLFWSPYLGQAYLFYRHALMYWVKSLRKKDMSVLDMSQAENHWTPVFRLSYRKATRWLGKSNHKIIPGGIYECHRSDIHRRLDQCLPQCCEVHIPHNWQPEKDGGGRCYYWRPGLLQRLYEEQLLAIEISGSQRATIQIWRHLPLLTPHQINHLNPFLQEEHDRWLDKHGQQFDLTLNEWLTISQSSLVPLLPAHNRRLLKGSPPANPFLPPHGSKNGVSAEKRTQAMVISPEED
jgi:hypothetical protein